MSASTNGAFEERQDGTPKALDLELASKNPLNLLGSHSSQGSPPTATLEQRCTNCGTVHTPLWRRAPGGALICNACGLYYKANNAHRPVNLKQPPNYVSLQEGSRETKGSCEGDGHCNGMGGKSLCVDCPSFNNRIVVQATALPLSVSDAVPCRAAPRQSKASSIRPAASETSGTKGALVIACTNCHTTVTPLWRRSPDGATICNACGLYYKLHNCYRPVTLKKSTIKRRKRVNVSEPETTKQFPPPLLPRPTVVTATVRRAKQELWTLPPLRTPTPRGAEGFPLPLIPAWEPPLNSLHAPVVLPQLSFPHTHTHTPSVSVPTLTVPLERESFRLPPMLFRSSPLVAHSLPPLNSYLTVNGLLPNSRVTVTLPSIDPQHLTRDSLPHHTGPKDPTVQPPLIVSGPNPPRPCLPPMTALPYQNGISPRES